MAPLVGASVASIVLSLALPNTEYDSRACRSITSSRAPAGRSSWLDVLPISVLTGILRPLTCTVSFAATGTASTSSHTLSCPL